jgi:hypothetical protein
MSSATSSLVGLARFIMIAEVSEITESLNEPPYGNVDNFFVFVDVVVHLLGELDERI